MDQLIIIGASGHGKVVADIARLCGYKKIDFLDDNQSLKNCGTYKVIGLVKDLKKYINDMKAITEDANASQESKDIANNALVEKAKMNDQESRVESEIRNKGYEDSICMINDNKTVKVYVKVSDVLSEENSAVIKKVVEDITTLTDVDITSMK